MLSEQKVSQIAAFFLSRKDEAMPHLKLIKLMYLADRLSMARFGVPLSDDRAYSMPHGPVLSRSLNLMKGQVTSTEWSSWVSPLSNHKLRLVRPVSELDDLDELSPADIAVLNDVWAAFGRYDQFALRDLTHDGLTPEWEDPRGSSREIDPALVFRLIGDSAEVADQKVSNLLERRELARVMSEFT
ncbi:Panacea domain-containing protein [Halopseudomonas sp.]|uniref:Panacea domain-containing protein n=1 Tax=Halopseudomonas sp. TaxID=2901191 RepID=UPI00312016CC